MAGRNVSYIKPQTPSFIEKFKKKVGYQEAPSVETKFQENESSSVDEPEREDEKPTVVLGSNVSEMEADAFLAERLREEKNADATEDETHDGRNSGAAEAGKIVFKKPTKRKSSDSGKDLNSSKKEKKKAKTASSMKKVKNNSLLSFDDEDEDTR